jgi:hypothetical protein
MDRRERYYDEEETLRIVMRALQGQIWTAMPGVVAQYPGSGGHKMTVDVQVTVNGSFRTQAGAFVSKEIPLLRDCPVCWQGGGGAIATFPIAEGDECLVVFAARNIDSWFKNGSAAPGALWDPPSGRMHDLSDGFALVGVRSMPNAFDIDPANASLQSVDGTAYFKLNPTTKSIAAVAPGGITLNGVTIDASGNIVMPADSTLSGDMDDLLIGGVSLANHVHSGVQTGGGDSGPPVP